MKRTLPSSKQKIFNKEAITIYGSSAAKVFYDPRNFKRKGAMPKLVLKTRFWSRWSTDFGWSCSSPSEKYFYGSNDTGKNGRLSSYFR